MKVVLTRKLAKCIDGVDVSDFAVGDVINLGSHDAKLLMAEDWAVRDRRRDAHSHHEPERRRGDGGSDSRAT